MHGRYERRKPKKGKKVVLIVMLILLILLLSAAVVGILFYNSALNKVNRAEVIEKPDVTVDAAMLGNMDETEALETTAPAIAETTEPTTVPTTLPYTPSGQDIINVLVVGQSAREGEEYRMADTMILVTVNKTNKSITLTSFLRDAYVKLPDYMGHVCGKNRINVCYHLGWLWGDTGGAMEMTNLCLKNNFGIEVDYNVEIDFNAFTKIIDVLGGVRIDLDEAEVKYMQEKIWYQEFEVGENRLFGNAALEYARMRKAEGDADSDIKRTARQRKLVTALVKKFMSRGIDAVQDLANEILPMITTNMTNEEITTCIWEILPMITEMTIESGTCPVSGSYRGDIIDIGDYPASILRYDEGVNRKAMMALTEGTPAE